MGSTAHATKVVLAVQAVKNEEMGLKKGARLFDVNRSTLQKKVQGKLLVMTLGPGHPTALPLDVEEQITSCLKVLAEWGFGITRSKLSFVVGDYCSQMKLKTPFKENIPGSDWLQGSRHVTLI